MKTAGDILSALFDEGFVKKAQGYSKFFDSWTDITAKNGISAAADHSRIKDLDRGIVLIEMDHPGWKQILQTKQSKLLNDFRIRFPELDISGISLMLGSGESQAVKEVEKNITAEEPSPEANVAEEPTATHSETVFVSEPASHGYDSIKDEEFKEKLKQLGQTIAEHEKR